MNIEATLAFLHSQKQDHALQKGQIEADIGAQLQKSKDYPCIQNISRQPEQDKRALAWLTGVINSKDNTLNLLCGRDGDFKASDSSGKAAPGNTFSCGDSSEATSSQKARSSRCPEPLTGKTGTPTLEQLFAHHPGKASPKGRR